MESTIPWIILGVVIVMTMIMGIIVIILLIRRKQLRIRSLANTPNDSSQGAQMEMASQGSVVPEENSRSESGNLSMENEHEKPHLQYAAASESMDNDQVVEGQVKSENTGTHEGEGNVTQNDLDQ